LHDAFGKAGAFTCSRNRQPQEIRGFDSGDQFMFDGKNNRILDSFSFRFVMTAGVFVAWFVAGYMLIAAA